MHIELLTQLNFRNLNFPRLVLQPGLTVITGANGAGKSNLLAACYLGLTAELQFGRIADAVRLGEQEAFVSVRFEHSDGVSLVEAGLGPGRRLIRLDGNQVRAEQLASVAAAVLMTPEDSQLVHGAPAQRRAWLDSLLSRISQRYARLLSEYQRVLAQRNALLRQGWFDAGPDIWSEKFTELGSAIEDLRSRALVRLADLAAAAYREITAEGAEPARRELGLSLLSATRGPLAEALAASRAEERARGVTVVGPHRDELVLELGGHSLRTYGSRGEARTAALALKVAEFRLLAERHGEEPVLLLDDFSAELDRNRRAFLLGLASSVRQALATATEPPPELSDAVHLQVSAGTISHG